MMTKQAVVDTFAPSQALDFPSLESLYERILQLDTGCEIWLGHSHAKTGPIIAHRGKRIQVCRVLWFYEYGILPASHLLRLCDPVGCVATIHRTVSLCA